MPTWHYRLDQCLSAPLRQQIANSRARVLWPCDDLFGSTVRDVIGNRHATGDNLSRGDPGMLPEYGTSVSCVASKAAYFTRAHDSALVATASVAIGLLFRAGEEDSSLIPPQTIFRKDSLRLGITGTAQAPVLRFEATISGALRTLDYVISNPTEWKTTARYLVARYTGTAQQLLQITSAGIVTLATAAQSGSLASGSGAIYVGQNGSGTEYLTGSLQHVAYWVDDYPTDSELSGYAAAMTWTDLTPDVLGEVEATWGTQAPGPRSRVSNTGTLVYVLRNDAGNSGGRLGYYSPDHVNVRPGFGVGNPVRLLQIDADDPATTRVRWIGKLVEIEPVPGWQGTRGVRCLAVDYVDELARTTLPAVTMQPGDDGTGVRLSEAVGKLLTKIVHKPHRVMARETATEDSYLFGVDRADDSRTVVLQELARIADSDLGWIAVTQDDDGHAGTLMTWTRRWCELDTVPRYTVTDTMHGLTLTRRREEIYSRVQVQVTPRAIDGMTKVIYSLDISQTVPSLAPGERIQLRALYTDPDDTGRARIGAADVVTPVAAIDYQANAASDGSGADLTQYLSVTFAGEEAEAGVNSAVLQLQNTGPTTLYVRRLQLRGRPIRSYQPVVCEAIDEAMRRRYGEQVLSFEQPYEHSVDRAAGKADYLKRAYARDTTVVRSLTVNGLDPAVQDVAHLATVGDLIRVTESVSGVTEYYRVAGVRTVVRPRHAVETTLFLDRRESRVWVLGVSGYSELGVSTYVGI